MVVTLAFVSRLQSDSLGGLMEATTVSSESKRLLFSRSLDLLRDRLNSQIRVDRVTNSLWGKVRVMCKESNWKIITVFLFSN